MLLPFTTDIVEQPPVEGEREREREGERGRERERVFKIWARARDSLVSEGERLKRLEECLRIWLGGRTNSNWGRERAGLNF